LRILSDSLRFRRFEATKAPVRVLVVDHIDHFSAN
jgi:hypothetical protein